MSASQSNFGKMVSLQDRNFVQQITDINYIICLYKFIYLNERKKCQQILSEHALMSDCWWP